MEVIGRVESGTETESNAGAVAEDGQYAAAAWTVSHARNYNGMQRSGEVLMPSK